MIITPIGDDGRLFQVENIFPADLLIAIIKTDWDKFAWTQVEGQENTTRRRLVIDTELQIAAGEYINQLIPDINYAIGQAYTRADTNWWVDQEGYNIGIHTDGHLPSAMQIYLTGPGEDYGTVFYYYNNPDSVRHAFKFKQNTGYLVVNTLNPDGSQPLMWHGMMNPVPAGVNRLTTYTILR